LIPASEERALQHAWPALPSPGESVGALEVANKQTPKLNFTRKLTPEAKASFARRLAATGLDAAAIARVLTPPSDADLETTMYGVQLLALRRDTEQIAAYRKAGDSVRADALEAAQRHHSVVLAAATKELKRERGLQDANAWRKGMAEQLKADIRRWKAEVMAEPGGRRPTYPQIAKHFGVGLHVVKNAFRKKAPSRK
jgi:hypothetical protein